jgi:hypothetical protein
MKRFALPLGVGLLVLVGGAALYAVLTPFLAGLREEVSLMRAKVAEAEGYARDLEDLRRREAELREMALRASRQALPSPMPDQVLARLQEAAVASGARLLRLNQVAYEEGDGGFGRQRFQAVFGGKYPQVRGLLQSLASWEVAWGMTRLEMGVDGAALRASLDFEVPVFPLPDLEVVR